MNLAYLALLFTWITVFRQMGRQCRKRIKGFTCFKCLDTSWSLLKFDLFSDHFQKLLPKMTVINQILFMKKVKIELEIQFFYQF